MLRFGVGFSSCTYCIFQIVGGLHLAGGEFAARIPQTVDFLADRLRPSPTYVLPMHCTGFQAKIALEKALGEDGEIMRKNVLGMKEKIEASWAENGEGWKEVGKFFEVIGEAN